MTASRLRDILVSICFPAVILLLIGAGYLAWRHFISTPPYVDDNRFPVRGIDISAHNGTVDMRKVAEAGYRFVFIKASEGESFRDANFAVNYQKARRAGLKTGAYHFFRFDKDGIDQARNLVAAVGGRKLDLGVAIDVEQHGNPEGIDSALVASRLRDMTDFLNLVGYHVTFYSNREGYADYLRETVPGSTLWICAFSENPINAEWTFWQYDHHGKVPGIEGDVDLNAFCGNLPEWNNYLHGAIWPYDIPAETTDSLSA